MVLARTLQCAEPEEGCALLLGLWQQAELVLVDSWPCLNRWQPASERRRRFAVDPREQLLAQRWTRARGLQVLGAAHSHPSSAAEPSTTDLALCVGPALMLIQSGRAGEAPAAGGAASGGLRAWWVPGEGGGAPWELPILVAAAEPAPDLGE